MISVLKKSVPELVYEENGSSMEKAIFWYTIASGTAVDDTDKIKIVNGAFKWVQVDLSAGTEYIITCADNSYNLYCSLYVYDAHGNQVAYDNMYMSSCSVYLTPSESGTYFIRYGACDNNSSGTFTSATVSPAPNEILLPEAELHYHTSGGFNDRGSMIRYRCANTAGCGTLQLPQNGLLCHFSMDDKGNMALDDVHGIELTANGKVKAQQPGFRNYCWKASASGDYLAGNNNAFTLPEKFTLNAFVFSTGAGIQINRTVVDFGTHSGKTGFGIWTRSDSGNLIYRIGSSFGGSSGGFLLPLNQWHMVTMTYDKSNVKLYLDGILNTTISCTTAVVHDSHVGMFRRKNYTDSFFGAIDEVGLWDRVMSDDEVGELIKFYSGESSAGKTEDMGRDDVSGDGGNIHRLTITPYTDNCEYNDQAVCYIYIGGILKQRISMPSNNSYNSSGKRYTAGFRGEMDDGSTYLAYYYSSNDSSYYSEGVNSNEFTIHIGKVLDVENAESYEINESNDLVIHFNPGIQKPLVVVFEAAGT